MLTIIPVTDRRTEKWFWQVPYVIYQNDPNWYPPLREELQAIFNEKRNPIFRLGGKARRWILLRSGEPVGRIAAFVNPHYIRTYGFPVGGFGFFECIPDQECAHTLLHTAEDWLRTQGMEAVDGPINFGERNRWWGLLIENFSTPTYGVSYNPPYYRELIESAGYQILYHQLSYLRPVNAEFPERLHQMATPFLGNPEYAFVHLKWKELDRFVHAFVEIYRRAWAGRPDQRDLTHEEVYAELKNYRRIIDPELLWFAFRKNQDGTEEPLAFFIMFPDVTPIVQRLGGRLHLLNKLRFLWYLKRIPLRNILAILFGVVPEYRRTGLLPALVIEAARVVVPKNKYDTLEMYWIGDFHSVMQRLTQFYGAKVFRRHVTYRKMLRSDIPFRSQPRVS